MKLTRRQCSVLKLVCDGHSNMRIGQLIYLTEGSVKDRVSELLDIFQVTNRAQLLRAALLAGHYSLPGYTLQPIPWQETV